MFLIFCEICIVSYLSRQTILCNNTVKGGPIDDKDNNNYYNTNDNSTSL